MSYYVDCPYCGAENELEELNESNEFDCECSSCEKEFEVVVDWEPNLSSSEIIYAECPHCGIEQRNVIYHASHLEGKEVCHSCFISTYQEFMEKERDGKI